MRVFRIENEEGQGYRSCKFTTPDCVYKLRFDYSHEMPDGSERRQHPDADVGTELQRAYFDKRIYFGSPLRFGFGSVKDIYTWFCPPTIGLLELSGFNIYMYDIDDEFVIKGTRQVAFDPTKATKKQKISHKMLRHLARL